MRTGRPVDIICAKCKNKKAPQAYEGYEETMKKRDPIFLAISLAAIFCISLPLVAQKEPGPGGKGQTPKKEQADALFLKAKEAFAEKDFDGAEAGLKACLEVQPGHADALFFLAQVDYSRGNFAQALVDIEKAKEAHAAASGDQNVLTPKRRNGLLDERARKEEELARLEAILYSASCKTDIGKFKLERSTEYLRREISQINVTLNQRPASEPLPLPADYSYIHGNILFKMNRLQEAESEYLRAIAADPRYLPAHNNLVNLCYVSRYFERALKYVRQAETNGLEINPRLKEAIVQLAKKDN